MECQAPLRFSPDLNFFGDSLPESFYLTSDYFSRSTSGTSTPESLRSDFWYGDRFWRSTSRVFDDLGCNHEDDLGCNHELPCQTCEVKIIPPTYASADAALFDVADDFHFNGVDVPMDGIDEIAVIQRSQVQEAASTKPDDTSIWITKERRRLMQPTDRNRHSSGGSDNTSTCSDHSGGSDPSTTIRRRKKQQLLCKFCKNNRENLNVYSSHNLKDEVGHVVCPILRRYTCPLCGATGDFAHTIKYCPMSDQVDHATLMQARLETELMNKRKSPKYHLE